MKKGLLLLVAVCLLLGASSRATAASPRLPPEVFRALDAPAEVTLYSLHPVPQGLRWRLSHKFHDYRILGSTCLANAAERREVAAVVRYAAQHYESDSKCMFQPRHGVHLVSGGHTYDFLICFQCQEMIAFAGERQLAHLSIVGKPYVLDRLLRAAHLRVAE